MGYIFVFNMESNHVYQQTNISDAIIREVKWFINSHQVQQSVSWPFSVTHFDRHQPCRSGDVHNALLRRGFLSGSCQNWNATSRCCKIILERNNIYHPANKHRLEFQHGFKEEIIFRNVSCSMLPRLIVNMSDTIIYRLQHIKTVSIPGWSTFEITSDQLITGQSPAASCSVSSANLRANHLKPIQTSNRLEIRVKNHWISKFLQNKHK